MNTHCEVDGCENTKILARGWCQSHYYRWYVRGDINAKVKERTKEESKTPEYRAWKNMKKRCNGRATRSSDRMYTIKGIQVCQSWKDSYYAFLKDVGRRPSVKHSLDRIDNDGNYEPSNVRWATSSMQALNKGVHPKNTSGHTNVYRTKDKKSWWVSITRDQKAVNLGTFRTIDEAVIARDNYLNNLAG